MNNGMPPSNINGSGGVSSTNTPLGDAVSTDVSLPLSKFLAHTYLWRAPELNNTIADPLLGNFYQPVSNLHVILNEPNLHQVILSLMKSIIWQLISKFQRLG